MQLSYPPAPSYYAAGNLWTARAPLRGESRADVVVLGAGIAGLSTALHLTSRGFRVAVLEARAVGYGASGRSGGQTILVSLSASKTHRRRGTRMHGACSIFPSKLWISRNR